MGVASMGGNPYKIKMALDANVLLFALNFVRCSTKCIEPQSKSAIHEKGLVNKMRSF